MIKKTDHFTRGRKALAMQAKRTERREILIERAQKYLRTGVNTKTKHWD
jgi:hypothetical protein